MGDIIMMKNVKFPVDARRKVTFEKCVPTVTFDNTKIQYNGTNTSKMQAFTSVSNRTLDYYSALFDDLSATSLTTNFIVESFKTARYNKPANATGICGVINVTADMANSASTAWNLGIAPVTSGIVQTSYNGLRCFMRNQLPSFTDDDDYVAENVNDTTIIRKLVPLTPIAEHVITNELTKNYGCRLISFSMALPDIVDTILASWLKPEIVTSPSSEIHKGGSSLGVGITEPVLYWTFE